MQSCDCFSLLRFVLVISLGIFLTDPWVAKLDFVWLLIFLHFSTSNMANEMKFNCCKALLNLRCLKNVFAKKSCNAYNSQLLCLLLQLLQLCLLCCCVTICFDCCFLHLVTLFAVLWRIFRQQLLFWRCASMRKCMLLHLLSCLCRLWSASCSSCSSCSSCFL